MAAAGGIRAGKAFVEIFADNNPLIKGLRAAEGHLKQWGATVQSAGLKMAAVGGAVMAPLLKGISAFGDFENQMKKVSTQLQEPEKWMGQFSSGIRKLSKDVGEGTDTLSKGLYDILSAGIDASQSMNVLAVASKAAKGGMTDTAVAVDGLTSVLNSFGLAADQAGRVSDVMFASVLRGKMEFPDLAANIGKVAPMAKIAGMELEDMFAVLSTMTRKGLSTEEATTRLTNILKEAPQEAANILDLIKRYEGADLMKIMERFTDIRAAGGIATLAGDIEGLTEDLKLMRNSAGMAEVAFGKMMEGISPSFKKAQAVITDMAVTIGEALAPTIGEAVAWFQKFAQSTGEWISQNKGAVVLALKFGASLVGLGVAAIAFGTGLKLIAVPLGIFRTVLALVIAPLRLFGTLLAAWPIIIAVILKPIGALMVALSGITSIVPMLRTIGIALSASLALLLNPITLVIVGIVALGVAVLATQGFFSRALSNMGKLFGQLKNDAVAAFGAIGDALSAGDIAAAMKILWALLKVGFQAGVLELKRLWFDFIASFKLFAYEAGGGFMIAMESAFTFVESLWVSATQFMSDIWNGFIDGILAAWDWVGGKLSKAWNWMSSQFSDSFDMEAANSEAEAYYKRRKADIEKDAKVREAAQKRERAMVAETHDNTMALIGAENRKKAEELGKEIDLKLAANKKSYALARKEWQKSLKGSTVTVSNRVKSTDEAGKPKPAGISPEKELENEFRFFAEQAKAGGMNVGAALQAELKAAFVMPDLKKLADETWGAYFTRVADGIRDHGANLKKAHDDAARAAIFKPIVDEFEKGSEAIDAAMVLTRNTVDDQLSATEEKLRSATEAWNKMRAAAVEAKIDGSKELDEQRDKVLALRDAVESLKQVQILQGAQKDMDRSRQTSDLQGGGVNLQEDQRQSLIGAYNQMSEMPGFDAQSAMAQQLRADIESLQTPMQAFIGQLQAIPPLWQQIGSLLGNTFDQLTTGLGTATAQLIVYGGNVKKVFADIGKQILTAVIGAIIKMAAQAIISAAVTTFVNAFASTAAIPIVGPAAAPGVAAGAVATMLGGIGGAAAAGASATYLKGGISTHPQLAAVSERGRPEIHLTRPNIKRHFPELSGSGGRLQQIQVFLDRDVLIDAVARGMPDLLRLQGVTI